MTKPMIKIHDIETDEIIEREMNDAEFAQFQADEIAAQAKAQAETEQAAAKAQLLAQLGITEDQARLLLS